MATQEEQQKLINTLKFTPRTYTVSIWGYGGERVMGTVEPKVWNYCQSKKLDLQDIAWDDDICEELGLDPDMLPFSPGAWYECDSMGHISGASRDSSTIQVLDENNNTVFEKTLEACDGCDDSPELFCDDEVWIGSRAKGEIVFVGSSNEKGTFFEGEIALTAPFDITKLGLHYDEFDGEDIVTYLTYNDEEIDNYGGGTDGKSSDFNMVRIIDDEGNWQRYDPSDPVEVEVAHETGTDDPIDFPVMPEITTTDWFPADINPVRTGVYEVMIGPVSAWPFPNQAHYTWTGKTWKDVDGKKATIHQWRGLVADAS
jgi:hypothetical protein